MICLPLHTPSLQHTIHYNGAHPDLVLDCVHMLDQSQEVYNERRRSRLQQTFTTIMSNYFAHSKVQVVFGRKALCELVCMP